MTSIEMANPGARAVPGKSAIAKRETNWGMVFTETAANKQMLALAETTLRNFGLLVVLGGGAIPLLRLPMLTTLGFALAFVFVGYSIFRYANNGLRTELRIDTRFGGVRVGTVNAAGDFSEKRAFPRSEIESFFIQRSKSGSAKLCMRLKEGSRRMILFKGSEEQLVRSFEKIVEVLFVKEGSGQRVKTRANDRFIHATVS